MELFWNLGKSGFNSYDFTKLIDTRVLEECHLQDLHFVCDIDKTYLETNFSTKMQMLKIAFEDAKDKVTVPGASPFLTACRWGSPYTLPPENELSISRALHFVSASPPQLRKTLEEKLRIDDLDWTSDSFKNQAYNIRKGKIGLLRHHVLYKTATLYNLIKNAKDNARFILIGDNAEFDSFIYMGMAYYLKGLLNSEEYIQYLLAGGVQDEVAADLKQLLQNRPNVSIEGVLIREVPGLSTVHHHPITKNVTFFSDYFQAMCYMIYRGFVDIASLPALARRFHNQSLFSRELILSHLNSLSENVSFEDWQTKVIDDVKDQFKKAAPLGIIPEAKNQYLPFSLDETDSKGSSIVEESEIWAQKLTRDT